MRRARVLPVLSVLTALTTVGVSAGQAGNPRSTTDPQAQRVPALIEDFNSRDFYVHRRAASALIRMGPSAKEAVPALIEALRDPDGYHRMSAATVLGYIGPPAEAATSHLIHLLKEDEDDLYPRVQHRPAIRAEAVTALGKIGSFEAIPALIDALRDADSVVRGRAINSLGRFGPAAAAAIPALTEVFLKAEDSYSRERALDTLAQIGLAAVPALYRLDADRALRRMNPLSVFLGIFLHKTFRVTSLPNEKLVPLLLLVGLLSGSAAYLLKRTTNTPGMWACFEHIHLSNTTLRRSMGYVSAMVLLYLCIQFSLTVRALSTPFFGDAIHYRIALLITFILFAVLVGVMFAVSPSERSGKLSLYLFAFLSAELMLVLLAERLLPGGHPSLGAILWLLFAAMNPLITALAIVLFAVGGLRGEKRAYVIVGTIYVLLVIGLHPLEDVEAQLKWIGWKVTPVEVRLFSGDYETRRTPLDELRRRDRTSNERLVPELIGKLKGGDRGVRLMAIEALGRMGGAGKDAAPALIEIMKGDSVETALQAISAIGFMGPEVAPAVIETFQNKDEARGIRQQLASVLGYLRPPPEEAVRALIDALQEEDEGIRWSAADAIGTVGLVANEAGPSVALLLEKEAVPSLVRLLKDGPRSVRASAAKGLGGIGPPAREAVPPLILTLDDPSEYARKNAADALARIGTSEALDELKRRKLKGWWSDR